MLAREPELPVVYHENVLCLMVQGPDVLFAYWDLSFGHIQAISGQRGLILCLYKDSELYNKVNLPPFTNNWYFRNVEPGCEYYCELGIAGDNDIFLPLLRSNHVNTPPLTTVEEVERETVRVAISPLSDKVYKAGEVASSTAFIKKV